MLDMTPTMLEQCVLHHEIAMVSEGVYAGRDRRLSRVDSRQITQRC